MNVHEKKVGASPSAKTSSPDDAPHFDSTKDVRQAQPLKQPGRSVTRRLVQTVLPIVMIALGYATYSYLKLTRPEKSTRPAQEQVFTVHSITAKPETIQPKIKIYGSTVAGRRVDIRALVAGRVIETSPNLKEGGRVNYGDILLRIDPFSYKSAVQESEALLSEAKARVLELEASIASDATSLESAKKQLDLARIDVERAAPLARRGTVSQRTVDERQQTFLQRQQSVDQLTNSIKVWTAKVAQQKAIIARLTSTLALARRHLEETALKAPFNAYVVDVTSQEGRMVSANDKVATLIDRDWVEVKFTLSDEQFGRILGGDKALEGRKIDVFWVLGEKKILYPATIERVGAQVNATTGGVEVLARISDPNHPVALRSGAFVEVMVPDKTFVDVFRIPPTSLYEGNTVYVIENGRLTERSIKVVGAVQNDLLVEGPLNTGDHILTTRVSTPGTGVRVDEIKKTN